MDGQSFSLHGLFATIIFVLTTTDSMSLSISVAITGDGDPSRVLRVFWALLMGAVAVLLITVGEDSVDSLQSFIVVTTVPVSILLLTTFWTAPKACKQMAEEQGIIPSNLDGKRRVE